MVQYLRRLDSTFAALSDPTRRGVLERLGRGDASITDLAERFDMTLTGMKKHVQALEDARLVTTEKRGRVRVVRLGANRLEQETAWIEQYRTMLEGRLDRLGAFLERGNDIHDDPNDSGLPEGEGHDAFRSRDPHRAVVAPAGRCGRDRPSRS